MLNKMEDQREK